MMDSSRLFLLIGGVAFVLLVSLWRMDNAMNSSSMSISNPMRVIVVDKASQLETDYKCYHRDSPPCSTCPHNSIIPSSQHSADLSSSLDSHLLSAWMSPFHQEADVNDWSPHSARSDPSIVVKTENGHLVKRYAPAPGSAGQVRGETTFGKALQALASRPDVRRMIEIGTWYGQGSTAVIGRAFKATTHEHEQEIDLNTLVKNSNSSHLFERSEARRNGAKYLWTLEVFEPAWQFARDFVAQEQLPVRCILGGTVPAVDLLPPSAVDENERKDPNSHFGLYYQRDVALMKEFEPWLLPLCAVHAPLDAVLIDGNEYSGWAEYLVVDGVCKPRFLALHDMSTLKTHKIEEVIARENTNWVLWHVGYDAVKWAIYVHKDYQQQAIKIQKQP